MKAICTIIAKNYVAFARTLCHSFLEQHPDGRCFTLVIDDWEGFIDPVQEAFEIVSFDDLSLPQSKAHFTFKYDITELSTALKPFLLEHLLDRYSLSSILYLDPDILVTGPLDGLYARLSADCPYDFVLTPHLDQDYPDDGLGPDDSHILTAGVFNLGFFGVRKSELSTAFLRWWQRKLTNHCVIAHAKGYFVDQRFIDLAITLFSGFFIEKNVGYNAAYWNLHSRRFSRSEDGQWFCNGGPLYFYHFSNYKFDEPKVLAGHLDRYHFSDRPDLQPLFLHFRELLMAHGHERSRHWPYTFGSMRNGRPIPFAVRQFYRRMTGAGANAPRTDPFESKMLAWISATVLFYKQIEKNVRRALKPVLQPLRHKYFGR